MNPKTVGLILAEEVAAADLMGPAEVFSRATIGTSDQPEAREPRCYRVITIGISAEPCMTECGIVVRPDVGLEEAPPLDTVFICSSRGFHSEKLNRKLLKWLKQRAPNTRRIAALGRGIYALAATGLLDGRQGVIHWRFAKDVASRFPKLRVNPNNLFVKDGPFYTCAAGPRPLILRLLWLRKITVVMSRWPWRVNWLFTSRDQVNTNSTLKL